MATEENFERTFVGREAELALFREMLKDPYGDKHIMLVLGDGGIGKTYLVREMLGEAKKQGFLAPDEPIDLFSTDYRHIDGIQWRIKQIIEDLLNLEKRPSPFADWIREKTDTSEKFYECLKSFCEKTPVVLAFDTFENLDKVASDWLFKGGPDGLQVPGLVCIVAGRDKEREDIATYQNNPLVLENKIRGFTVKEANDFFSEIKKEGSDLNNELLRAAGLSGTSDENSIEWIVQITNGHPLRLEMVFRWLGTLLGDESLTGLTADEFEERLMVQVRELAERGQLDAGAGKKISQPVYDTLLCMAHITRRFDEGFLRYFINNKELIRLTDPKVTTEDIIASLERYFFVKVRQGNAEQSVLQLHDEMARLVRKYVWPFQDNSAERKLALLDAVGQYYDQLIAGQAGEEADTLRVEKLYYTFQRDWEGGLREWFELAEEGSANLNKLLPGEIRKYLSNSYYDDERLVEIHRRVAEMERNAGHIKQAVGHWEKVRQLGEKNQREDWVVDALIGLFNCRWPTEPGEALREYLEPAQDICEKRFPERLALVYYEIGFAYRQMQDYQTAVEWYEKGIQKFRESPADDPLEGILPNDLGYAYLHLGKWGEAAKYLKEALDRREERLHVAEKRLREASPEDVTRRRAERNQAASFVGLTRNTLGEYHRYVGELDEALKDYDEAYARFVEVNDYYWQAKCLCARGETYRRLAWQAWEQGREDTVIRDYAQKAKDDIEKSLYLCEKYQHDDERDTAYRRRGRLSHDFALMMQEQNVEQAREKLEEAYQDFKRGLEFARKTKETLEELENLTELAFLADDSVRIYGREAIPDYYRKAVDDLESALKKHRKDTQKIYQYPVFEALWEMERAAIAYAEGDYPKALKGYVKAFKGVGTFPGYGHARYKQHFGHLTRQIENLPDKDEQVRWCRKFIEVWKKTAMPGREGKTLADDLFPDLVKWCNRKLKEIEKS